MLPTAVTTALRWAKGLGLGAYSHAHVPRHQGAMGGMWWVCLVSSSTCKNTVCVLPAGKTEFTGWKHPCYKLSHRLSDVANASSTMTPAETSFRNILFWKKASCWKFGNRKALFMFYSVLGTKVRYDRFHNQVSETPGETRWLKGQLFPSEGLSGSWLLQRRVKTPSLKQERSICEKIRPENSYHRAKTFRRHLTKQIVRNCKRKSVSPAFGKHWNKIINFARVYNHVQWGPHSKCIAALWDVAAKVAEHRYTGCSPQELKCPD